MPARLRPESDSDLPFADARDAADYGLVWNAYLNNLNVEPVDEFHQTNRMK